jgi:hypothetical protein
MRHSKRERERITKKQNGGKKGGRGGAASTVAPMRAKPEQLASNVSRVMLLVATYFYQRLPWAVPCGK